MSYVPHVSASQVEDFNLCPRKWAFRQFSPKEPPNIGAFRGDSGHRIIEAYGKDKTPPETHEENLVLALAKHYAKDLAEKNITAEDYAARIIATCNKMIEHLPEPPWGEDKIEQWLAFELDGVNFSGRVDLQHSGNVIHDHKFSGSRADAKTPDVLLTDPQALIYSWWRLNQLEPVTEVRLNWLYGFPGPKSAAKLVEQVMPFEHVAEAMKPIVETGKKIVRLKLARPDPLSLEPNWNACIEFGGCPYQDKCQPTAEQLIGAMVHRDEQKESKKMGLIAKKKAEQAGVAQGAQQPTTGQRSDTAGVTAEASAMAEKLLGIGLTREDVIVQLQKKFVGLPKETIAACLPPLPEEKKQAINPPDSPEEKETPVEDKKAKAPAKGKVTGDEVTVHVKALVAAAAANGLTVAITFTARA